MFGKRSEGQRTSDDRARAAAERAARRAGSPLPPTAFEDAVPPPDVEPHEPLAVDEPEIEAPPAAAPREEPVEPEPLDAPAAETPREEPVEEEPLEEPVAEAPREEPVAEAPREVAPPAPEPWRDDAVIHQPTVEYTPFQTEEHEAPLGEPTDDEPQIVAGRGPTATAEHEPFEDTEERPIVPLRPAPAKAAPASRRRPAPAAPRRRPPGPPRERGGGAHWGRRIFALFALALLAAALYVANATFQPFHDEGQGEVAVEIPQGSDAGRIGDILAAEGVVDSAAFFELKATISGDRDALRPGSYTLKKGMTNAAAIEALQVVPEGPKAVETVELRLLEGPSRKENAPVVDKSKKVEGGYARASSSKATLKRIRELGAPKGTKTAEGFLFPATYTLPEGSSANDLVKAQLDAFEENFAQVDMKAAKRANLTRYDVLIIASMIEREAQLAKERPLVSAVIYNRLKQGMALQIDATTRYSTNNWQRPIRQSELDADEPYNTRKNLGLPPTPIGNPGLASLQAAAKPSNKDYLFYVRKPGKTGEHAFSSTDEQFARDVAKYQQSREGQ